MQGSGFGPRQRDPCPYGQTGLFCNGGDLALKIKIHGEIMGQHHFQHQQITTLFRQGLCVFRITVAKHRNVEHFFSTRFHRC